MIFEGGAGGGVNVGVDVDVGVVGGGWDMGGGGEGERRGLRSEEAYTRFVGYTFRRIQTPVYLFV